MSILVSGGAGYIGSHTCIELMNAGYEILVADNLYNSCEEAMRRVEQIAGRSVPFVNIDLCDAAAVDEMFRTHPRTRPWAKAWQSRWNIIRTTSSAR